MPRGVTNQEQFIEVTAARGVGDTAYATAKYFAAVHATATAAGGTVLVRRGGITGTVLYTLKIDAVGTRSLHASGLVAVAADGGLSVTKDANISEFTVEYVE